MSLRRAAPGPQLSAGRLRVDAGKAIAKLREYQLADRTAWVLEAIRAAVAAKATRIELAGDANDIWLGWDGTPWPDAVLPRLFDELVSPEAASESQHVRLLAAAINSALGLEPAYVDITAVHEDRAVRVRYTPEILVEPSSQLGASALRHVAAEPIAVPEGARPGMRIHLRRRLGDWRVFSEAPELGLARRACRDIAVPLHVTDLVLHRDASRDIVRVPLGEGLDGFIAVTELERADATATLEVAERGVVLVEYVLDLFDTPSDGPAGSRMPIRVFVDAPRMPTNASRSQVRRDAHPIADAEKRAHALVPTLLGELAKAVQQGSERARAAALALLAAHAGGSRWHVDVPSIRGPLRELALLPLVKNAVGQPRPLTSHWRAEVHTGGKPFDAELAPWLDHVMWAPDGDPATQLIAGVTVDTRGTRRLVRWARRQLRAQKKFFAHQKREIRVLTSATPHVRAPLGVAAAGSTIPPEPFDGLTGEICIYAEGTVGALVITLEGRELERVEYDSPLAFDAVIDSARVTPGDRYTGVKRNAEYARVERAMRAGIVRALEAHALATRDPAHAELDARLFRRGLGVIREVGGAVKGPLAAAPAFRTIDGRWLSLVELAKEQTIGIAPPLRDAVVVPSNRVVVLLAESERRLLTDLVKARFVTYRRTAGGTPMQGVAASMTTQAGGALFIREPDLVAVIAPSSRAELRLFHTGVELAPRNYLSSWLKCSIAIDCDAIVPDEDWMNVADDAGLVRRDHSQWELALVRAIAQALLGEAPPALTVAERVELDSPLGRVLCEAIRNHDPRELLGDELHAKLRTARILHTLGGSQRSSIADIAERFSGPIPYLERDTIPVADFPPLIARKPVALALAKLVGRDIVDGEPMLERHRRRARREQNLAAHRTRPQQPMTIPADDHVSLATATAHGLVGLWDGPFEIRVFVEGRPFTVVHPPERELPIVAAIEIKESMCGDTFEALPDDARRTLGAEVRGVIPALVLEIGRRAPDKLADQGPARTLLASAWVNDDATKRALRAIPAFHTLQGGRVSIEQASQPHRIVSVASWEGEWLGPDGEPHELDGPVLWVPDANHELSKIVDKLHPGSVVDVTDEVTRLQGRRRVARGLVPTPRVSSAPPELKRSLHELGPIGTQLGVGEIGLVEDETSLVSIYVNGQRVRGEQLDVLPAVAVAVELAEPRELKEPVEQLTELLVKEVLGSLKLDALPARIQRNLVRAALARKLDRDALADLALWRDFTDQLDRYGDVWVMMWPTEDVPLDPQRRVFFFERSTFELAQAHHWNVVDASKELALDAIARKNLARKPAVSLTLPTRDGVLAQVLLDGDGVTAPRGVVAVLAPNAVQSRGTWPHRSMHPFDRVDDPCKWPTLAVIDDARLTPDRTWSAPQQSDVWAQVTKELRAASERALLTIGEVPEDAHAHVRINAQACADVAALRKAPRSLIRGVLWLIGDPHQRGSVRVSTQSETFMYVPDALLPIGGRLLVFAPDRLDVTRALEQLCGQIHGKLVRALLKGDALDTDLVAAHVAHALAQRTVRVTDVRGIEFPCFVPRPLDARALSTLLHDDKPVLVTKPTAAPDPEPSSIEVIDDGSLLANTIIEHLGPRMRRFRPPPPKPRPAPEQPRVVSAPKQQPARAKPPEPPHPLLPLVKKLRVRLAELGIGGYRWVIVDRSEPMFSFADEIEVAGDNVRLRALAAALLANSPLLDARIDIIVAHLVTVLNVSLSQITDASEAHALGVLLANPQSAGPPRSRRSS